MVSMGTAVIVFVIFFLRRVSWPLLFLFLLACIWMYCIVGSFHIGGPSCYRYLEVAQYWLQGSNMVLLPTQLSIQVPVCLSHLGKSVSRAAAADEKFMKASSISSCFTLLALSYPVTPVVC